MHDDGPDVDAEVEDDDYEEAYTCSLALTQAFHVEDETETEASDTELFSQDASVDVLVVTYMQKNGEMRDDRARARTEK